MFMLNKNLKQPRIWLSSYLLSWQWLEKGKKKIGSETNLHLKKEWYSSFGVEFWVAKTKCFCLPPSFCVFVFLYWK